MQFFFRFCAGNIDEYMDIFLDTKATKEAVIQAGIASDIGNETLITLSIIYKYVK